MNPEEIVERLESLVAGMRELERHNLDLVAIHEGALKNHHDGKAMAYKIAADTLEHELRCIKAKIYERA